MIPVAALVTGLQLLSATAFAQTPEVFPSASAAALQDDASGVEKGAPDARNRDAKQASGEEAAMPSLGLERQLIIPKGTYIRTCDCSNPSTVKVDDIRAISDEFAADGNTKSKAGLSNMVWGFGQFLDHDLALTIENEKSKALEVETEDDVMELHRAVTSRRSGCKNPLNGHTPGVDVGPVYGSDRLYLDTVLRVTGTCRLRVADGDFLPLTTNADDDGRFLMLAGDVRVSEHAFLASQHTVWVREHNRLCAEVEKDPRAADMSGDQMFELVRRVVIAKFQQVVLTEFLPALGISQSDVENAADVGEGQGISVEFSIAYRLGHDLIGNDVGGIDIADTFNAEAFFLESTGTPQAPSVTYKSSAEADMANIMNKLATTRANEVDGKLSDALRNALFGHAEGQDLVGRNIFRGRDLGIPTYAGLAKCFGIEPDATVEAETPDAWLGLMREPKASGEALPPTLKAIVTEQFHRSFFARRDLYWRNTLRKVGWFASEIERSTYAEIITANTATTVTGNVFRA